MKVDLSKPLSRKATVAVIITVIVVVLAAIGGVVGGHYAYENNQQAIITNMWGASFSVESPLELIYFYDDTLLSVDLNKALVVSKGASFGVTKLIDENGNVFASTGNIVDVSTKRQRLAMVRVVSKSGKKKTDYRVKLVPESERSNVIKFNGASLSSQYYSGSIDIKLPEPTRTYLDYTGAETAYKFLGWYTTPDFQENTRITTVPAGTSGEIALYASYAAPAPVRDKNGHIHVAYGEYPTSVVTDFTILPILRNMSGPIRTYGGIRYYAFTPAAAPNVASNGYSTSTTYFFKFELLWWRVCLTPNASLVNGQNVTLLCDSVIDNINFYTTDTISSITKSITDFIGDYLEFANGTTQKWFNHYRHFYDVDSAFHESGLKAKLDEMWNANNFTDAEMKLNHNTTVSPALDLRKKLSWFTSDLTNNTEDFYCNLYPFSYTEACNAAYGFLPAEENGVPVFDPLKRAVATDFALANGAFSSTAQDKIFGMYSSWWFRGDDRVGREPADKTMAYCKYNGVPHYFFAVTGAIRSGVRPSVDIKYDVNILGAVPKLTNS